MAGSAPGVGTTHFCILLANYMAGVMSRKTAVLEWNENHDFERIERVCRERTIKTILRPHGKIYSILGVSYYEKAGKAELLECVNQRFDSVIIDFGHDWEKSCGDFLCCGRKFLVGAFCEWRLEQFVRLLMEETGTWEALAAFGSDETACLMKRKLNVSVKRIPRADDAFVITGELMAFFGKLLRY